MSALLEKIAALGPELARRGAETEGGDDFVAANYAALKQAKILSAMVPAELGGGGVAYSEMCAAVRTLAHYCSSTALSVSMHQHLVATFRWNYEHGRPGEKPLRAVAEKDLVLVSTGAGDWLASKGMARKVDGGFRVSAHKAFASGSPAGGLLVTTAPYEDPSQGWQVLHFPVPVSAEGVSVRDDWQAMGMRGTGSNTVTLDNVFVPEEAVSLRRPRGRFHPFYDTVVTVALPMFMSAYAGIAEAAAELAVAKCRRMGDDGHRAAALGEMLNQLTVVQSVHAAMVANVNELDFEQSHERSDRALRGKTVVAEATIATVEKAIDAVGGSAYFRKSGLERLLRDAYAGKFHAMQARKQHVFSGRLAMGLGATDEMDWLEPQAQAAE